MISVIVALYNEESRFPKRYVLLQEFLNSLKDPWELLLVDDGSKDGTYSLISSLAAKDQRIRVLRLNRNLGQGAAVKLGVLSSRGDVVMYTDADLSVPFRYFNTLIDQVRSGSDVAIASRWMRGATVKSPQPLVRRVLGRIYYWLVHALILERIEDCNCGLKAYRGESARVIFGFLRSWRWGFNIEHLWIADRLKLSIVEIPIEWSHNAQSKVRVFRDCFFTLWELSLIQLRRVMGGYPKFQIRPRSSVPLS